MNGKTIELSSSIIEPSRKDYFNSTQSKITAAKSFLACFFVGVTMFSQQSNSGVLYDRNCRVNSCFQSVDITQMGSVVGDSIPKIDLMKVENLNKIKKMELFEYNWNGNGGKPFSRRAISFFIEIIDYLRIQPKIAPTGRNSLLMQYESNDKSFLAFEVFEDKVDSVFIPKGDYSIAIQETFESEILFKIKEKVDFLYGKE